MTKSAATFLRKSSTPSKACLILNSASHANGIETIPTVRIPRLRATPAMTGEAPVPVPPPIPAVINTISVSSSSNSLMRSTLSSANCRATRGSPPAPRPGPRRSVRGIFVPRMACLSVLHRTKVTSFIPVLNIFSTAFPPPPPTPITLMMAGNSERSTTSNCGLSLYSSISKVFSVNFLYPFPLSSYPKSFSISEISMI